MSEHPSDSIPHAITTLLTRIQSVHIATINNQGNPENSYTPFLKHDDRFYIFISELAAHTQNLKSNACASLLFIEDESQSKNLFARKRLILNSEANFIARDDAIWDSILTHFTRERGNTIELLKTLPDFWLVELKIKSGTFIQGFGQAYRFDQCQFDRAEQITGK